MITPSQLSREAVLAAPTVSITDGFLSVVVWENPDSVIRARHDRQFLGAPSLFIPVDGLDTVNFELVRARLTLLELESGLCQVPAWMVLASALRVSRADT